MSRIFLMVELSQIIPPDGFNLFVIYGLTGEIIGSIEKHAFSFFLPMVLTTAIITLFPEVSLFLPRLMIGK